MAGIIDIRYNPKTRRWVAKPRFVWDAETMKNGAPTAEGASPTAAAYEIAQLLPDEMGAKLSWHIPRRIYRSPEYEWMDDKCIEVDGHCPSRYEFQKRRATYLRKKEIESIINSVK